MSSSAKAPRPQDADVGSLRERLALNSRQQAVEARDAALSVGAVRLDPSGWQAAATAFEEGERALRAGIFTEAASAYGYAAGCFMRSGETARLDPRYGQPPPLPQARRLERRWPIGTIAAVGFVGAVAFGATMIPSSTPSLPPAVVELPAEPPAAAPEPVVAKVPVAPVVPAPAAKPAPELGVTADPGQAVPESAAADEDLMAPMLIPVGNEALSDWFRQYVIAWGSRDASTLQRLGVFKSDIESTRWEQVIAGPPLQRATVRNVTVRTADAGTVVTFDRVLVHHDGKKTVDVIVHHLEPLPSRLVVTADVHR